MVALQQGRFHIRDRDRDRFRIIFPLVTGDLYMWWDAPHQQLG